MAEQQLVDYIKKAKSAGQTEDQSRNLLLKNGWTDVEINEAFASLVQLQPQIQAQPQAEPQIQAQPKTVIQPQVKAQPQNLQPQSQVINQQEPQYKPQFAQSDMPAQKKSHLVIKLFMVLISNIFYISPFFYIGHTPKYVPVVS